MAIEYLDLEERREDRLAAVAIGHVSGGHTVEVIDAQIAERRELRKLVVNGLDTPICPELTNANPSAPHTVLIEAFAWMLSQQAYRFNQVPQQNLIAFANLFGIDRRPATAAVTKLRFTVDPPANTNVTIPIGTEVSSEDGKYVFETTAAITILFGTSTGDAPAIRTASGHTLLSPDILTRLIDTPAYVDAVTNPFAVDSGLELEPLDQTLERVRRYQRRGERIVSTKDLEDAMLDDGLLGNGIVRAFPFVENGDFASGEKKPGYTTVIVMTRTGEVIDSAASIRIAALLDQMVGNQFIYIVNPQYIEFNVTANVRLQASTLESDVLATAEANLRNFYAAAREQFGRGIYRSEIIAVIEGTGGVDRVVASGPTIIASPEIDSEVTEYQLAKLVNVTLTAV